MRAARENVQRYRSKHTHMNSAWRNNDNRDYTWQCWFSTSRYRDTRFYSRNYAEKKWNSHSVCGNSKFSRYIIFLILQRDDSKYDRASREELNRVQLSRKFHWHPTVALCPAIRIDLHTKLLTLIVNVDNEAGGMKGSLKRRCNDC